MPLYNYAGGVNDCPICFKSGIWNTRDKAFSLLSDIAGTSYIEVKDTGKGGSYEFIGFYRSEVDTLGLYFKTQAKFHNQMWIAEEGKNF